MSENFDTNFGNQESSVDLPEFQNVWELQKGQIVNDMAQIEIGISQMTGRLATRMDELSTRAVQSAVKVQQEYTEVLKFLDNGFTKGLTNPDFGKELNRVFGQLKASSKELETAFNSAMKGSSNGLKGATQESKDYLNALNSVHQGVKKLSNTSSFFNDVGKSVRKQAKDLQDAKKMVDDYSSSIRKLSSVPQMFQSDQDFKKRIESLAKDNVDLKATLTRLVKEKDLEEDKRQLSNAKGANAAIQRQAIQDIEARREYVKRLESADKYQDFRTARNNSKMATEYALGGFDPSAAEQRVKTFVEKTAQILADPKIPSSIKANLTHVQRYVDKVVESNNHMVGALRNSHDYLEKHVMGTDPGANNARLANKHTKAAVAFAKELDRNLAQGEVAIRNFIKVEQALVSSLVSVPNGLLDLPPDLQAAVNQMKQLKVATDEVTLATSKYGFTLEKTGKARSKRDMEAPRLEPMPGGRVTGAGVVSTTPGGAVGGSTFADRLGNLPVFKNMEKYLIQIHNVLVKRLGTGGSGGTTGGYDENDLIPLPKDTPYDTHAAREKQKAKFHERTGVRDDYYKRILATVAGNGETTRTDRDGVAHAITSPVSPEDRKFIAEFIKSKSLSLTSGGQGRLGLRGIDFGVLINALKARGVDTGADKPAQDEFLGKLRNFLKSSGLNITSNSGRAYKGDIIPQMDEVFEWLLKRSLKGKDQLIRIDQASQEYVSWLKKAYGTKVFENTKIDDFGEFITVKKAPKKPGSFTHGIRLDEVAVEARERGRTGVEHGHITTSALYKDSQMPKTQEILRGAVPVEQIAQALQLGISKATLGYLSTYVGPSEGSFKSETNSVRPMLELRNPFRMLEYRTKDDLSTEVQNLDFDKQPLFTQSQLGLIRQLHETGSMLKAVSAKATPVDQENVKSHFPRIDHSMNADGSLDTHIPPTLLSRGLDESEEAYKGRKKAAIANIQKPIKAAQAVKKGLDDLEYLVFLDLETTYADLTEDSRLLQAYIERYHIKSRTSESLSLLVNPGDGVDLEKLRKEQGKKFNIDDPNDPYKRPQLLEAPSAKEQMGRILNFIGEKSAIVAHSGTDFDVPALHQFASRLGFSNIDKPVSQLTGPIVDPLQIYKSLMPNLSSHKLEDAHKYLGLDPLSLQKEFSGKLAHLADYDVAEMKRVMEVLFKVMKDFGNITEENLHKYLKLFTDKSKELGLITDSSKSTSSSSLGEGTKTALQYNKDGTHEIVTAGEDPEYDEVIEAESKRQDTQRNNSHEKNQKLVEDGKKAQAEFDKLMADKKSLTQQLESVIDSISRQEAQVEEKKKNPKVVINENTLKDAYRRRDELKVALDSINNPLTYTALQQRVDAGRHAADSSQPLVSDEQRKLSDVAAYDLVPKIKNQIYRVTNLRRDVKKFNKDVSAAELDLNNARVELNKLDEDIKVAQTHDPGRRTELRDSIQLAIGSLLSGLRSKEVRRELRSKLLGPDAGPRIADTIIDGNKQGFDLLTRGLGAKANLAIRPKDGPGLFEELEDAYLPQIRRDLPDSKSPEQMANLEKDREIREQIVQTRARELERIKKQLAISEKEVAEENLILAELRKSHQALTKTAQAQEQVATQTEAQAVQGRRVLALIGASGSGKDTVTNALLNEDPRTFGKVVSDVIGQGYPDNSKEFPGRVQRRGEVDGHDYNFISGKRYEENLSKGSYVSPFVRHGAKYGINKEQLNQNKNTVAIVNQQGARDIKDYLSSQGRQDDFQTAFVSPISMQGHDLDSEEGFQRWKSEAKSVLVERLKRRTDNNVKSLRDSFLSGKNKPGADLKELSQKFFDAVYKEQENLGKILKGLDAELEQAQMAHHIIENVGGLLDNAVHQLQGLLTKVNKPDSVSTPAGTTTPVAPAATSTPATPDIITYKDSFIAAGRDRFTTKVAQDLYNQDTHRALNRQHYVDQLADESTKAVRIPKLEATLRSVETQGNTSLINMFTALEKATEQVLSSLSNYDLYKRALGKSALSLEQLEVRLGDLKKDQGIVSDALKSNGVALSLKQLVNSTLAARATADPSAFAASLKDKIAQEDLAGKAPLLASSVKEMLAKQALASRATQLPTDILSNQIRAFSDPITETMGRTITGETGTTTKAKGGISSSLSRGFSAIVNGFNKAVSATVGFIVDHARKAVEDQTKVIPPLASLKPVSTIPPHIADYIRRKNQRAGSYYDSEARMKDHGSRVEKDIERAKSEEKEAKLKQELDDHAKRIGDREHNYQRSERKAATYARMDGYLDPRRRMEEHGRRVEKDTNLQNAEAIWAAYEKDQADFKRRQQALERLQSARKVNAKAASGIQNLGMMSRGGIISYNDEAAEKELKNLENRNRVSKQIARGPSTHPLAKWKGDDLAKRVAEREQERQRSENIATRRAASEARMAGYLKTRIKLEEHSRRADKEINLQNSEAIWAEHAKDQADFDKENQRVKALNESRLNTPKNNLDRLHAVGGRLVEPIYESKIKPNIDRMTSSVPLDPDFFNKTNPEWTYNERKRKQALEAAELEAQSREAKENLGRERDAVSRKAKVRQSLREDRENIGGLSSLDGGPGSAAWRFKRQQDRGFINVGPILDGMKRMGVSAIGGLLAGIVEASHAVGTRVHSGIKPLMADAGKAMVEKSKSLVSSMVEGIKNIKLPFKSTTPSEDQLHAADLEKVRAYNEGQRDLENVAVYNSNQRDKASREAASRVASSMSSKIRTDDAISAIGRRDYSLPELGDDTSAMAAEYHRLDEERRREESKRGELHRGHKLVSNSPARGEGILASEDNLRLLDEQIKESRSYSLKLKNAQKRLKEKLGEYWNTLTDTTNQAADGVSTDGSSTKEVSSQRKTPNSLVSSRAAEVSSLERELSNLKAAASQLNIKIPTGDIKAAEKALEALKADLAEIISLQGRLNAAYADRKNWAATPEAPQITQAIVQANQKLAGLYSKELPDGLRNFKAGLKDIESKMVQTSGKGTEGFNRMHNSLMETIGTFGFFGFQLGFLFRGIQHGLMGTIQRTIDSAAEFEKYRVTLEGITKSFTKAQDLFDWAKVEAIKTPFDVKDIIQSTVQLTAFGLNAKKVLPDVLDLASGMGKDVTQAAHALGAALAGSPAGFRRLRQTFAITTTELAAHGAHLNRTGGLLLLTSQQMKDAAKAAEEIVREKFGGVTRNRMNAFQAAVVNIKDAIQRLQDEALKGILPHLTQAVKWIIALLEKIEEMPQAWKEMGVSTILAGGALSFVLGIMATGSFTLSTFMRLMRDNGDFMKLFSKDVMGGVRALKDFTNANKQANSGMAAATRGVTQGMSEGLAYGAVDAIDDVVVGGVPVGGQNGRRLANSASNDFLKKREKEMLEAAKNSALKRRLGHEGLLGEAFLTALNTFGSPTVQDLGPGNLPPFERDSQSGHHYLLDPDGTRGAKIVTQKQKEETKEVLENLKKKKITGKTLAIANAVQMSATSNQFMPMHLLGNMGVENIPGLLDQFDYEDDGVTKTDKPKTNRERFVRRLGASKKSLSLSGVEDKLARGMTSIGGKIKGVFDTKGVSQSERLFSALNKTMDVGTGAVGLLTTSFKGLTGVLFNLGKFLLTNPFVLLGGAALAGGMLWANQMSESYSKYTEEVERNAAAVENHKRVTQAGAAAAKAEAEGIFTLGKNFDDIRVKLDQMPKDIIQGEKSGKIIQGKIDRFAAFKKELEGAKTTIGTASDSKNLKINDLASDKAIEDAHTKVSNLKQKLEDLSSAYAIPNKDDLMARLGRLDSLSLSKEDQETEFKKLIGDIQGSISVAERSKKSFEDSVTKLISAEPILRQTFNNLEMLDGKRLKAKEDMEFADKYLEKSSEAKLRMSATYQLASETELRLIQAVSVTSEEARLNAAALVKELQEAKGEADKVLRASIAANVDESGKAAEETTKQAIERGLNRAQALAEGKAKLLKEFNDRTAGLNQGQMESFGVVEKFRQSERDLERKHFHEEIGELVDRNKLRMDQGMSYREAEKALMQDVLAAQVSFNQTQGALTQDSQVARANLRKYGYKRELDDLKNRAREEIFTEQQLDAEKKRIISAFPEFAAMVNDGFVDIYRQNTRANLDRTLADLEEMRSSELINTQQYLVRLQELYDAANDKDKVYVKNKINVGIKRQHQEGLTSLRTELQKLQTEASSDEISQTDRIQTLTELLKGYKAGSDYAKIIEKELTQARRDSAKEQNKIRKEQMDAEMDIAKAGASSQMDFEVAFIKNKLLIESRLTITEKKKLNDKLLDLTRQSAKETAAAFKAANDKIEEINIGTGKNIPDSLKSNLVRLKKEDYDFAKTLMQDTDLKDLSLRAQRGDESAGPKMRELLKAKAMDEYVKRKAEETGKKAEEIVGTFSLPSSVESTLEEVEKFITSEAYRKYTDSLDQGKTASDDEKAKRGEILENKRSELSLTETQINLQNKLTKAVLETADAEAGVLNYLERANQMRLAVVTAGGTSVGAVTTTTGKSTTTTHIGAAGNNKSTTGGTAPAAPPPKKDDPNHQAPQPGKNPDGTQKYGDDEAAQKSVNFSSEAEATKEGYEYQYYDSSKSVNIWWNKAGDIAYVLPVKYSTGKGPTGKEKDKRADQEAERTYDFNQQHNKTTGNKAQDYKTFKMSLRGMPAGGVMKQLALHGIDIKNVDILNALREEGINVIIPEAQKPVSADEGPLMPDGTPATEEQKQAKLDAVRAAGGDTGASGGQAPQATIPQYTGGNTNIERIENKDGTVTYRTVQVPNKPAVSQVKPVGGSKGPGKSVIPSAPGSLPTGHVFPKDQAGVDAYNAQYQKWANRKKPAQVKYEYKGELDIIKNYYQYVNPTPGAKESVYQDWGQKEGWDDKSQPYADYDLADPVGWRAAIENAYISGRLKRDRRDALLSQVQKPYTGSPRVLTDPSKNGGFTQTVRTDKKGNLVPSWTGPTDKKAMVSYRDKQGNVIKINASEVKAFEEAPDFSEKYERLNAADISPHRYVHAPGRGDVNSGLLTDSSRKTLVKDTAVEEDRTKRGEANAKHERMMEAKAKILISKKEKGGQLNKEEQAVINNYEFIKKHRAEQKRLKEQGGGAGSAPGGSGSGIGGSDDDQAFKPTGIMLADSGQIISDVGQVGTKEQPQWRSRPGPEPAQWRSRPAPKAKYDDGFPVTDKDYILGGLKDAAGDVIFKKTAGYVLNKVAGTVLAGPAAAVVGARNIYDTAVDFGNALIPAAREAGYRSNRRFPNIPRSPGDGFWQGHQPLEVKSGSAPRAIGLPKLHSSTDPIRITNREDGPDRMNNTFPLSRVTPGQIMANLPNNFDAEKMIGAVKSGIIEGMKNASPSGDGKLNFAFDINAPGLNSKDIESKIKTFVTDMITEARRQSYSSGTYRPGAA